MSPEKPGRVDTYVSGTKWIVANIFIMDWCSRVVVSLLSQMQQKTMSLALQDNNMMGLIMGGNMICEVEKKMNCLNFQQ